MSIRHRAWQFSMFLVAISLALSVGIPTIGSAQEIETLAGHSESVYAIDVSRDGKWIVTGSFDKTLRIWDVGTRKTAVTLTGHTGSVLTVAISADGQRIASGSLDNIIKLWDFPKVEGPPETAIAGEPAASETAKTKEGEKKDAAKPAATATDLKGHSSHVYGVCFSPDGKLLASVSADKTVRLWNVAEKKLLKTIVTQDEPVYGVAFSPDGKTVLTAGGDNSVRLYDVAAGNEIRKFDGPQDAVYSVCYNPDGSMIAAGGVGLGQNRKLFVWNIGESEPASVIDGLPDDIYRVPFDSSGKRLLTAGYSGSVRVWDLTSRKEVFATDLPILYSACYSRDGKYVFAGCSDQKVYVVALPESAQ